MRDRLGPELSFAMHGERSPPYLAHISPISRMYLAHISPISRLYLLGPGLSFAMHGER